MKLRIIILSILLALNLVQYNLWQYMEQYCTNFFYKCETAQYIITFYLMKNPLVTDAGGKTPYLKTYNFILRVWLIFAINDAVDLLLFDPTKFGWNEVIFCIAAIIHPLIAEKWTAAMKRRASL